MGFLRKIKGSRTVLVTIGKIAVHLNIRALVVLLVLTVIQFFGCFHCPLIIAGRQFVFG